MHVIRRILMLPVRFVRFVWEFLNPRLKAGAIPYGRIVVVTQVLLALVFLGYTLSKKSIRVPIVSSEPYQIHVLFEDAQGLDRLDEPAAAVAGTPLGIVTDVDYEDGKALVTMTMEDSVRGKVFADASVAVRPASALQNLLVNIDPGTPETGPLPEDAVIAPERTSNYVAIDELTSILDADTRAYTSILLQQAQIAVKGRSTEFQDALIELGELVDTTVPISRGLAKRRRLLTDLVGELNVVGRTLASRGAQLAAAIQSANDTLAVTAAREPELAESVRLLAPVLSEAERSVASLRRLADPLQPVLEQLGESAPDLAASVTALHDLYPEAERLTNRFERLVSDGERPLELLEFGTRGIGERAAALVPVMKALTKLTTRLDRYKRGMLQTSDLLASVFSTQDHNGAYAPIAINKIESARPENFGLGGAAATREGADGESRLDTMLAKALELTCVEENPLACLMRFNIKGLPDEPVTSGGGE